MPAKLIEPAASGQQPREILISKDEFLIGRGSDCDLSILESEVSRHHCLIRVRPEERTIADLGSSNGTFVNGQRIRTQTALQSGDEIQVGSARFLIDLGDAIEFKQAATDPAAVTIKAKKPPII
jgi:pSer/pThr/pTyr-binding forkhead associated (FHA) protein